MNKRILNLLFLSIILRFIVSGQQCNTVYFMDRVPQSNHPNPARMFPCKFYIGAPGLAPFQASLIHSGPTFNDIYVKDPSSDSMATFLHPEWGDPDKLLKSMNKVNYLMTDASVSIASIGFYANPEYFITFEITEKANAILSYPRAFFEFMPVLGKNEDGKEYDMHHLAFEAKHYREYAIGISKKVDYRWTVGLRPKLLFGKFNISTRNDLTIKTGLEQWEIPESGITVNSSNPLYQAVYDSNGNIRDVEEVDELDVSNYLFNKRNYGLAIDFGAIYQFTDKIEFSASVIDLGGINWRSNNFNWSQQSGFLWKGINMSTDTTTKQDYETIADSMRFEITQDPYASGLQTKLYLGARYLVNKNFSVGLLNRNMFFRGRLLPQLTMSANVSDKFISASLSYSMMYNSFDNFGFGINFKVAPFNLYIIMDNMPIQFYDITQEDGSRFLLPYGKVKNIRLGLNLVFGCKDIGRDKPLIL